MPQKEIDIKLPDGKVIKGTSYATTPFDIAHKLLKKHADKFVVAKVKYVKRELSFFKNIVQCEVEEIKNENSGAFELLDMNSFLEGDCELEFLPFSDPHGRETFWHSSAHILGSALEHLYNGYLTHGPPLKQGGFFYDIYIGERKLSPDDYEKIE